MKSLLALLLCCAALSAEAGVKIQHWVAPSGARVYFVETHTLPMLDVQVDFPAGGAYAPADKAGLAGLTNGLMDAGAGSLNEEQIAERRADLGVRLSETSDGDRAGMVLRTLSARTERDAAIDLLRTLLTQPTFPADVLAREKARTIASIQEADTRPDAIAAKRFAAALYPDHPYGRSADAASIERITREDLVAFHKEHYTAHGAVVSMIGDLTRAEAEAIAQRITEGLPAGSAAPTLPPVKMPAAGRVDVAHPAAQSHIHVGLPALKRGDPDFYALQVGNYVLGGGGFVSRLMNEVREKRGLVYDVHSYFSPRVLEGPFEIGLQTKREQAGEALKVVNQVLADYLRTGPTAAELKAAQQNMADGLALRIDSNAKLLGFISAIGYFGLPLDYLDNYAQKVRAVTAQQVREAFARHVKPEHLVTVVVAGDDAKPVQ
ncbi:MAG TPA: pitrilysin family protein [Rhodocyclaceae bacterium]